MQTAFGKFINIALISIAVIFGLVLLVNIATFFVVIGPGERGVLLELGKVKEVYEPGLHFQMPIITEVVVVDVRTQKVEVTANSASKDLQLIDSIVALNYHIDPLKVGELYSKVGMQYNETIISPAIQESIKASTAKYTAEELIKERPKVKLDIVAELDQRLANYSIMVDDVSIVNFDFSEGFNTAIEAKQTAEQNALKAKNDLQRIQIEAQQSIETAKAQAESIRIQGEALQKTPGLVQLKLVEKWNGALPYYYMLGTDAQPFISLPTAK
jgi:regulator of protease activity HflC (stomatin/prohibitin superfamily)